MSLAEQYARDVLSGKIVAGRLMKLACLAVILWAVTSCHPYPYKSIKPDKTKHAQFR